MTGPARPAAATRLALAALPGLARAGVRVPRLDPAGLRVGIVHLGVGAFTRAHQAVFTEDAMEACGDGGWAISAFTQRSAAVRDRLVPQEGLYTLLERGHGAAPPRVVGAVREVGTPTDPDGGPAARISDPAVRVVTLTVTEKGYRVAPGGGLDLADRAVRADLAGLARSRGRALPRAGSGPGDYRPGTAVGQLVAGLQARRDRHGAGLSVLSCDNLSHNGAVLRRLVEQFCTALPGGDDLAGWIADHVRFPASVVDRMVPAASSDDLADAARLLGVTDAATVVAEPFRQWVVEDDFPCGRPSWEAAGAVLTADVRPYQAAKLKLLNAAHSLLAYTGALAGHETIAQAVDDPVLREAAAGLMAEDAAPTLVAPPGFDLAGYQSAVLDRFANPALGHRTTQVAADGSLKLPIRLLGTVRERRAAGAEPRWAALAVAAWMAYVARASGFAGEDDGRRDGGDLPLEDPLAPALRAAAAGAGGDPDRLVRALLALEEVFPPELAGDAVFAALVTDHARPLLAGRRLHPAD